nr:hypothetical protein [Tanacetum cinerariifolium]GFA23093.1 hypothetical protein [Tanacetum cinerariifolium]
DEGITKIRAFMVISEDKPSVGKVDAMSGQWVDITMKKTAVKKSLSKLKAQSPIKPTPKKTFMIPNPFKECKYYGFNDHHSDHYEFYPRDHLGKFDQKVDNESFLGYSPVAKAFRVFNIRRQELEETVHATFSEDDEAISQSNTEGDAINFNENRSFPDEPKKLIEALEEEGWITAMQKELNQFERNKVWTLKPHGKTIIRTKEIWKNKMDENGIVIKNKARLVAQGHNQ